MNEARCWRCDRKFFEVFASIPLPREIAIHVKCANCKALNQIPLDTLERSAVAFA